MHTDQIKNQNFIKDSIVLSFALFPSILAEKGSIVRKSQ